MDIDFIKQCLKDRRIRWSYHLNMRLKERFISREMILNSVDKFEIIEEYPNDKYLPSCLIFSEYENLKFHIHIAVDYDDRSIVIVTAYKPSLEKWNEDFKTRRPK